MGSSEDASPSIEIEARPIDNVFKFPSPLPKWPQGEGFASGVIDLGSQIPEGFSMLGSYAQSNNKPLFGWVLVASDESGEILKQPVDYTLASRAYIYFHPKEMYLPSSVNWYFINGALLYKKSNESNPTGIEPNGSNLPRGGSNDGSYWLDLPADKAAQELVKRGDLSSAEVYLHSKPMLGATFTDIQVWIFYPFNGPATAKLGVIEKIPLGKIGEHVGDWEHMTLRISNFNGILQKVYFSQHNAGKWVDSSSLEFHQGNKLIGYSSRNGHANYPKEGANLQGTEEIGLRNDTAKSDMVLDTGKFSIIAADNPFTEEEVAAPPWLNYSREWGAKRTYKLRNEIKILEKILPNHLKSALDKLIDMLPEEIFGEHGPTGPKMKDNWYGDERDDQKN